MAGDYYELLQIKPEASTEEIHKVYRDLAMRYHPDRNPTSDAASRMAAINEAYSVLGEPSRRRCYDQGRTKGRSLDIAGPILRAAHDALRKQGWVVSNDDGSNMILEQGTRSVRVSLIERLDNALLRKIGRQFAGFSVVLAVEIETPINLSFHTAVIDLMRSRHHGALFPDDVYRALFSIFVSP
jgi:curved DNA-binding protein CbpA